MTAPLLEARGLVKSFGDNRVLRGIDVAVPAGLQQRGAHAATCRESLASSRV